METPLCFHSGWWHPKMTRESAEEKHRTNAKCCLSSQTAADSWKSASSTCRSVAAVPLRYPIIILILQSLVSKLLSCEWYGITAQMNYRVHNSTSEKRGSSPRCGRTSLPRKVVSLWSQAHQVTRNPHQRRHRSDHQWLRDAMNNYTEPRCSPVHLQKLHILVEELTN